MSLWTWLFRRPPPPGDEPAGDAPQPGGPIPLPREPYVFECRDCGKVFEVRRRRPICPECDSPDVELMSG